MTLADLLRENLDVDGEDVWENERTPTPVRCFAIYGVIVGTVAQLRPKH
jgi:hypothetical protein